MPSTVGAVTLNDKWRFPMPELNIKCSGTQFTDDVPVSECLGCALRNSNDCGYDYALLRFMFDQIGLRSGIHATDLVGCSLRSFWSKSRQPAEYPHNMLMRSLGTITHGLLESDEPDAGAWTERTFEFEGVVGTVDRYYIEPHRLVDYKTTRWLKVGNLPYGSHEVQVNIYAYLMRENGHDVDSGAIQYIDMSGPTKCKTCKLPVVPVADGLACPNCGFYPRGAHLGAVLFEVDLMHPDEIKAFVEQRRDALVLALELDQEPGPEPSFLCSYCSFLEECPAGLMHLGR